MVDEILPAIVVKAVSELSKTHFLGNWHINANFVGATITLTWMSPSAGKGRNASRYSDHGPTTKKSPSKKKRDFQRHQKYLQRRNEGFQDKEAIDVPFTSMPSKLSQPEYVTPPTSPKMERATSRCVSDRNPFVSFTSPEVRASPATLVTTHLPEETSVLPPEKHAGQLPLENAAGSDSRAGDSVVDGSLLADDKIVQCAFDGPMFVNPMSTSDIIRQLREGADQTPGIRGWCDSCAEPLSSWIACSKCDETSYCADCYSRTDHPKHRYTK